MNYRLAILSPLLALAFATVICAQEAKPQVKTLETKWQDAKRNREVRAKIYYLTPSTKPMPVIIFSHGLGASRSMYGYLGKAWAEGGFVSVHVQHIGSDDGLTKGLNNPIDIVSVMMKAVGDDDNLVNRPADVSFAIDQLTAQNTKPGDPLNGKLDMTRIGVGGNSFGAYTTLAIAGGIVTAHGETRQMADPRVKAAVAISAPSPMGRVNTTVEKMYAPISIPIMHVTGKLDSIPIVQNSGPEDRRVPFDNIVLPDQYLITFADADHVIFCGQRIFGTPHPNDPKILKLTSQSTLAFWNAYLNQDAKAMEWIRGAGMKETMGALAVVETKRATK